MSFDDSTSDSTVTVDAILCLLWVATKRLYDVFAPKIAAANLRRSPNPGLKLAAANLRRGLNTELKLVAKKLCVYADVRDLTLFKTLLIFARINAPIGR